jgi:hypothetical protein
LRQKLETLKYESSDDEEDLYKQLKLQQQFEQEVGQTGRFNRIVGGGYDPTRVYDDEEDDTYDEPGIGLADGT